MQYLKETFQYLKGVWWLLALLCLPAAVTLGFFIRPVVSIVFLPTYAMSNIQGFSDVMHALSSSNMFWMGWPAVLVFAMLFLMFCLTLPLIEKHFRIGRLSIHKPFSLMNHYFLPVLIIILIFSVVLVFYFALLVSLIALQHYLISGPGIPGAASIAVACVLAVGLFLLLCYFCSPFMFMIPLMQMYGYSFGDAFTSAVSFYGANKPFKITFGYAVIFLMTGVVGVVISSLAAYIAPWVRTLLAIALHLFLLIYFCAYCMVTTFRVTGMERKDLGIQYRTADKKITNR